MDRSAVGQWRALRTRPLSRGSPHPSAVEGPAQESLGPESLRGPTYRDPQRRGDRTNIGRQAPGASAGCTLTQPLKPHISTFQMKKPRSEMLSN